MLQDVLIGIYLVFINGLILWGVTGPRHNHVHWGLILSAFFVPFISFDLGQLGSVPLEAWLFCGFFLLGQVANTLYHVVWPKAQHARGPEILVQTVIIAWGAGLSFSLDDGLWYRGALGASLFCISTIFISMVVLMIVYQAELTSVADDEIDFKNHPLRGPSNAAFLCCSPTALLLTLYVALQNPLFVAAAVGAFVVIRLAVRPVASHPAAAIQGPAGP